MIFRSRTQQFVVYFIWTVVILLVSRILFDLLAGRPQFWAIDGGIESLLWNSVIGGPFIFFALLVAAQRQGIGK
jgi:hypothetical protein